MTTVYDLKYKNLDENIQKQMSKITGKGGGLLDLLLNKKPNDDDGGKMNHLYFYDEVDRDSCLELAQKINKMGTELQILSLNYDLDEIPKIYLHINSLGGCVFSAFTVIDAILQSKVPVVTIVEGACASAATLISVSGHERRMGEYGYFLMHQLRSGSWGKMNEITDEYDNCMEIMRRIKSHYIRFSNGLFKEEDLNGILEHDIWWTAKDCVEYGLIDKIMTGTAESIGNCINISKDNKKNETTRKRKRNEK